MLNSIKTDIQEQPNSKIKINFAVPFVEFEKFIRKASDEISKEIKIDGFRSGKVPFSVVEKAVGRDRLINEGAERIVKKVYVDAVLNEDLEVIGQPEINVKKMAWGNDFEFEAIATIMPKVKVTGWESGIRDINKNYRGKKFKVEKKEVERELEFLANQRAKLITVNREAKKGDQAQIDFEVFKDNVIIEGGTAKNHSVIIGKGGFIPGFEENLEGMKAGEVKEFELEFPKDYHQKHLAGQKARFKINVNLVQERQIPEINDEFAKGIGKFKSMEELRKNIKEGIEHEQKHKNEKEQRAKIINKLVEKTETDIPEILVDSEIGRMMQELEGSIAQMGLDKGTYFQQANTTEEKIKEQWRKSDAQKRVKAGLALKELAKEKKLVPERKEIEERMNQILQYYRTIEDAEKKIDTTRLYESVKGELANQKVLEYLMEL